MLRTIVFFTYFWLFLIFSLVIYGIFFILKILNKELGDRLLLKIVQWWARNILRIGGVKVKLSGAENIPKHKKVCFVSNHQSNYDIAIMITSFPMLMGFIAKHELRKYWPLRVWMDEIKCLFINRNKPKGSINLVKTRIAQIKENNPLIIFPEGTRSKDKNIRKFKTGSLKLLVENEIEIVPVSINGSYLCYEVNKRITPGQIEVVVHKSIKIDELDAVGKSKVIDTIYTTIEGSLTA